MLKHWYYWIRYSAYMHHPKGIHAFAELMMSRLIRRIRKRAALYREMNHGLAIEQDSLNTQLGKLQKHDTLDVKSYYSTQQRIRVNGFVIVAALLGTIFVHLIPAGALLEGNGPFSSPLYLTGSTLIMFILAVGGVVCTAQLATLVLTPTPRKRRHADAPSPIALWALLLLGIEIGLLSLADLHSDLLLGQAPVSILHYGFRTLPLLLPIVGGLLYWDVMRFLDVYKTTSRYHRISARLSEIHASIQQNESFEKNYQQTLTLAFWEQVSTFKTYKENYNLRQGLQEDLVDSFMHSFVTFHAEADHRYTEPANPPVLTPVRLRSLSEVAPNAEPATSEPLTLYTGDGSPDLASEEPQLHAPTGT